MPKIGFCRWAFAFAGLILLPCCGVFAATAKPAQWLQIHIGPDSAACGFTIPNNPHSHKLPVLLWLHGGMRSANPEKGFTAHRAALELVPADSFYFVSPSAYAQADWLSDQGIQHIDQALQWVFSHYPARPDSIIAMGVSDGTLGIIRYTLQGRYPLARRILVSTFPDLALPANQVPQAASLRHGSWDIFVGGQDRLFPNGPVMTSLEVWRQAIPRLTVHFEPLGEHDVSWWFTHQKASLTAALGSHLSP
jgi:predicted esterase